MEVKGGKNRTAPMQAQIYGNLTVKEIRKGPNQRGP